MGAWPAGYASGATACHFLGENGTGSQREREVTSESFNSIMKPFSSNREWSPANVCVCVRVQLCVSVFLTHFVSSETYFKLLTACQLFILTMQLQQELRGEKGPTALFSPSRGFRPLNNF